MPSPSPNRRWYHPTPDRFFIGLLVVQVSLLLSERFQWFAFNEKKGWTVLIGVGVVGLAVLVILVWGLVCLCLRRRFQFGVRSLLVLMVALSVPLGWLAREIQRARRQREAVAAITELGGAVWYDYRLDKDFVAIDGGKPTTPAWLRNVLGDDFFCDVMVAICPTEFDDSDAMHLQELANLERLKLYDTQITDNGLACLKSMTNLEILDLNGTQVTDVGLEHLKELADLEVLCLWNTRVTEEGIKTLQQALPNRKIHR